MATLTSQGRLGYRLPTPLSRSVSLAAGDTLILVSDGIGQRFRTTALPHGPVSLVDANILKHHRLGHDDALVPAVRLERSS